MNFNGIRLLARNPREYEKCLIQDGESYYVGTYSYTISERCLYHLVGVQEYTLENEKFVKKYFYSSRDLPEWYEVYVFPIKLNIHRPNIFTYGSRRTSLSTRL